MIEIVFKNEENREDEYRGKNKKYIKYIDFFIKSY